MKVKNRRSATRTSAGTEERNSEYIGNDEGTEAPIGKRKKQSPTRTGKLTKPSNTTLNNETPKVGKKKRTLSATNGCTTGNYTKSASSVHQSTSCSSASSVASGTGDPVDPYEFAVKREEEQSDCVGINNHTGPPNLNNVPPMKRMKLDRIEDRSLPDSARSSPLPSSVFSHSSPGPHSSPSIAHCTRPLSVLTDFSSSSGSRGNADPDRLVVVSSTSYSNGLDSLNHRPPNTPVNNCTDSHSPNSLTRSTLNRINPQSETPITTPAIDSFNLLKSPCTTNNSCQLDSTNGHCNSASPSPSISKQCSIASSTPTHRGVGVNTTLDSCKGTITEPDLLGPCEPGTTICLNGIVWLETTTGVLVVNVTWRGRTYIGTLLDATQHDFAPLCPRDYVPPFKSSVRSSNRTKRRAGLTGGYKQSNDSLGPNVDTTGKSAATVSGRTRLRGRNTSSPLSRLTQPTTSTAATSNTQSTLLTTTTSLDACAANRTNTDLLAPPSEKKKTDGKVSSLESGIEEDEITAGLLLSEDELAVDSSSSRLSVAKQRDSKRGASSSSSECPSDILPETMEPNDIQTTTTKSDNPSKQRQSRIIDELTLNSTRESGESTEHEDEELKCTFPITCPIDGCKKRFTHMTALRFHLNHTRHENAQPSTPTTSCASVYNSSENRNENVPPVINDLPPTISPPCPRSPLSPTRSRSPSTFQLVQSSNTITQHNMTTSVTDTRGANDSENAKPTSLSKESKLDHPPSSLPNESQASFPKPYITSPFTPGICPDSNGPNSSTTRTVTAHTVSIPYGSTNKADLLGTSSARPGQGYSNTTKHRTTSGNRSDIHKGRSQHNKFLGSGIKPDLPTSPSRQPQHLNATRNTMDFHNLPPFLPPAIRQNGSSSDTASVSHLANNLPFMPRDLQAGHAPVSSPFVPLPPGVWNFSSQSGSHSIPDRPSSTKPHASDPRRTVEGFHVNGDTPTPNRTPPNQLSCASAMNLTNYVPSVSSMNQNAESSHSQFAHSPAGRPPFHPLMDPSHLYGLPDFIVAAAMNALHSNGFPNVPDAYRSYSTSVASGLPRTTLSTPSFMGSGSGYNSQAPILKPANTSISSTPPLGLPTPPPLLAPMMGGSGPPLLPPSLLQGLGLVPPTGSSATNNSSDRMDPFKLSAAYFMQQAVAAGSQLSSGFGQSSS